MARSPAARSATSAGSATAPIRSLSTIARMTSRSRPTTIGVPAVRLSQNLFGELRRWLSELAGTAMIETSADAVQAGTSSGWTGGRVT